MHKGNLGLVRMRCWYMPVFCNLRNTFGLRGQFIAMRSEISQ